MQTFNYKTAISNQ